MRLIPYNSFKIQTLLGKKDIEERLNHNVVSSITYPLQPGTKEKPLFRGSVSEDGFKIVRVIRGRNSFLPIVIGKVNPCPYGYELSVKMRLNWFVFALMTFYIVGSGGMALLLLLVSIASHDFSWHNLFAFTLFAFGIILSNVTFQKEASITRTFFTNLYNESEWN